MADAYAQFRSARDLLLSARTDYDKAVASYEPPRPQDFNWALDWFDKVATDATTGARIALRLVEADGTSQSVTYAEMSARSSQVASWLSSIGAVKGDRLLLMLGNQVELWETLLGCIKL
ncbi:MAG: AMP-binding protein, partial [Dermatophilaceae bacterium]